MLKFFKAFTLAEVLLVMAIIGVTAMLAMPTVNRNLEEKRVVSALRKIYPELETAYNAMVKDYGKPAEWDVPASATTADMNALLKDRISRYLNVLTDCGTGTGCFTSLSNIDSSESYIKFLLKDGSSVAFLLYPMETIIDQSDMFYSDEYDCNGDMGKVLVDVNGSKGENKREYDIFEFFMCYAEGIVPAGIRHLHPGYTTGWVLKIGNRDYLKCEDLDFDTKRTCK